MSIFRESSYESPGFDSHQEKNMEDNANLEGVPLLFVDVNIGPGRTERIIVNEGDKSEDLAAKFADEFRFLKFL